jgi:hypothetical protein
VDIFKEKRKYSFIAVIEFGFYLEKMSAMNLEHLFKASVLYQEMKSDFCSFEHKKPILYL